MSWIPGGLLRGGDYVFGGHAEFFHDGVAGGADAEAVDAEDFAFGADVFPPDVRDPGLDGYPLGAGFRKDAFLVFGGLALEALDAWHGDDAGSGAELLGGGDGVLNLTAAGDENGLKRP